MANPPKPRWCKGFLAGIFDAEGSCGRGILRFTNTDQQIICWTVCCLKHLGFEAVVEKTTGEWPHQRAPSRGPRGAAALLPHNRSRNHAQAFDRRSCNQDKRAPRRGLRRGARNNVPMYDITTGTGDFIADGVVSHNCFARPTHTYLGFNAGRDFEREIVVKVNAPEVLRAELARPSWKGEHVALGTNTDPYQWVEGRYRLMVGIWEALRDARGGAGNPCSVLTKSPLLLRDLPLLRADRATHHDHRKPLDPHARRARVARNRAAHPQPARPPGGGGGAEPRRDPHRRADRPADAGHQRRPPPTGAAAAGRDRRRREEHRRRGAAPARRGEGRVHGVAAQSSAPTSWSATRSSTAAAPTRPARSARVWPDWCAGMRRARVKRTARRRARRGSRWSGLRPDATEAPAPPAVPQQRLF